MNDTPPDINESNISSQLLVAAQNNNEDIVITLLAMHIDVTCVDRYGMNALMHASRHNNIRILKEIMKCNDSTSFINAVDHRGVNLLSQSIIFHSPDFALALIATGRMNVNSASYKGITALMHAASRGYLHVATALLEAGALVNTSDEEGKTALMYCTKLGHSQITSKLISAGAYVNNADKRGKTALMYATRRGLKDFTELLKTGANVNVVDRCGVTPLILASSHEGSANHITALINAKADVNYVSRYGISALSEALIRGTAGQVDTLTKAKANINSFPLHKPSPLLIAIMVESADKVHLLLEAGADVRKVRTPLNNGTALMAAAELGSVDICSALIDAGDNISAVDDYGCNALMKATKYGHQEMIAFLIEKYSMLNK